MIKISEKCFFVFFCLFVHQGFTFPADCKVGDWKPFGECSATCNGGTKTRSREVVQEPMNGGAMCPSLEETETCNIGQCEGILLILSYEKCVNCDISERALPITETKNGDHFSIQSTPKNLG